MNVVLAALNAKYIHTSLALRYLRAALEACEFGEGHLNISMAEFNINQTIEFISGELYKRDADVIAFSCYIWNIEMTLKVIRRLKKMKSGVVMIVGGPEVTYRPREILISEPIDYVIAGEGEVAFPALLEMVWKGEDRPIKGVWFRKQCERGQGVEVVEGGLAPDAPLENTASPYRYLDGLENRLVNYETSRGCPFRCQYCLSGTSRRVRYFPFSQVKADIQRMVDGGVGIIKFVDRTFNCSRQWALQVWRMILAHPGQTRFHFEVEAGLLDEEMLCFLEGVPAGLFQFEIGVQSANRQTLAEVSRGVDLDREAKVITRLVEAGNIELFLDLIAGLPHESYDSFGRSFDFVYSLRPHRIQLGFLKLLCGSRLRERADGLGIVYSDEPPYEVLATPDISPGELLKLKIVEEVLEYYFNGNRARHTLSYLQRAVGMRPFAVFEKLAEYWEERQHHTVQHSEKSLYRHFYDFCISLGCGRDAAEHLKFDWLLKPRGRELPEWANNLTVDAREVYQMINCRDWVEANIPHLAGAAPRQILGQIQVAAFGAEVVPELSGAGYQNPQILLFDYERRHPITGLAKWMQPGKPSAKPGPGRE